MAVNLKTAQTLGLTVPINWPWALKEPAVATNGDPNMHIVVQITNRSLRISLSPKFPFPRAITS